MIWNWDYFSKIGYLSVLLWVGMLLLCLIYWKKPARLLCNLALVLAVAAFVCAKINSETYVNRIKLDRGAEIAKQLEQEEARQRAMLDSRGEDVAQIRFAEDGAGDFLDRAGMDEADLKYFESQGVLAEPEWKKEKKTRSGSDTNDGSIESEIGGDSAIGGMDSDSLAGEAEQTPIEMSEVDMVKANRYDALNLRVTRILIVVAVLLLLLDYLRRANLYGKASRPIPLPSSWLNALTPIPSLVVSKKRCRKSARGELSRLVKRGDSFIYLTDDQTRTGKLPTSIRRLPLIGGKEDLVPVNGDVDDGFVFETVWYGRSSFVCDSQERSQQLFDSFLSQLDERKVARAKVAQTAHLVWDLQTPMSELQRQEAAKLAKATGFSILLLRDRPDSGHRETNTPQQPVPDSDPATA